MIMDNVNIYLSNCGEDSYLTIFFYLFYQGVLGFFLFNNCLAIVICSSYILRNTIGFLRYYDWRREWTEPVEPVETVEPVEPVEPLRPLRPLQIVRPVAIRPVTFQSSRSPRVGPVGPVGPVASVGSPGSPSVSLRSHSISSSRSSSSSRSRSRSPLEVEDLKDDYDNLSIQKNLAHLEGQASGYRQCINDVRNSLSNLNENLIALEKEYEKADKEYRRLTNPESPISRVTLFRRKRPIL